MTEAAPDVIDRLVGTRLETVRAQRPQARDNAQLSYLALFHPAEPGEMTPAERHAVAVFVAGLHRAPDIAAFYGEGLAAAGGADFSRPIAEEVARGATTGPYGRFPAGPLSTEDQPGPTYAVASDAATRLGPRLTAALAHAHKLVFHPRDAAPGDLHALLDAGWTTTGIVTLSQLVAFLSFQIRVVAGLRALASAPAGAP